MKKVIFSLAAVALISAAVFCFLIYGRQKEPDELDSRQAVTVISDSENFEGPDADTEDPGDDAGDPVDEDEGPGDEVEAPRDGAEEPGDEEAETPDEADEAAGPENNVTAAEDSEKDSGENDNEDQGENNDRDEDLPVKTEEPAGSETKSKAAEPQLPEKPEEAIKDHLRYYNANGATVSSFDPSGSALYQVLTADGDLYLYTYEDGRWSLEVQHKKDYQ